MRKKNIDVLLVEDNENDVFILEEVFRQTRFLNLTAAVRDGQTALETLREMRAVGRTGLPDLIILDINLPGKDGFQVLTELKNEDELNMIPVIIFSTSTREEDILHAYEAGASTYISKPDDYVTLSEKIEHFARYWAGVARLPFQNLR